VPGLKVVMPATAYDAKGLMIAAIRDPNPVIFIDDRWLYRFEEIVPGEIYEIEIGKGIVRKPGSDITLVATSFMVQEALNSLPELVRAGIDVELIDPRTVKPIDENLIFESVRKTGRLVIADGGWKTCGMAAEISALVSENIFGYLKSPIVRVTLPDCPAPASSNLEKEFYKTSKDIVEAVKKVMKH